MLLFTSFLSLVPPGFHVDRCVMFWNAVVFHRTTWVGWGCGACVGARLWKQQEGWPLPGPVVPVVVGMGGSMVFREG